MLKRTLTSAAVAAAFAFAAAPASAEFMDFQVAEGSVPGNAVNTFTADKLNGGFAEYVTLTSATTFTASAYATFNAFYKNEGANLVAPVQINALGGYQLYALFSAQGTYAGANFTGATGAFTLYIDPDQDTTLSFDAGYNAVRGGTTTDDYEVAFTTDLTSGSGDLTAAPGAYDFKFTNFTLTPEGAAYFFDPSPFYINVQVNGDNDQFSGTNPIFVTGDVSAVFVPEPGTLALAGLALGAMGFVSRRRRAA
ncbi:hypothetical protein GCM10023089_10980 [Quisquiliibacterium transsilvanicum]